MEVFLVTLLRVTGCQGDKSTYELFTYGARINDIFTIKTPNWLPVAVLKVQI